MTAWLGNTPTVALRHYLLTTDSDFDRATAAKVPAEIAVQIPLEQGAELAGSEPQGQRADCENAKENGMLPQRATSPSGGHGSRTRNRLPGN